MCVSRPWGFNNHRHRTRAVLRKFTFDRITRDCTSVKLHLYMLTLRDSIVMVKPRIAVDMKQGKPSALKNVRSDLLTRRLRRGDVVFTAYRHAQPVGYVFAARESSWIGEIDTRLRIHADEIYLYDAFTYPAFRGKHIYPWLLTNAAYHYRQQGYANALIFTTGDNHASNKAIRRAGFSCYQRIRFYDLWGLKMWHCTPKNNHVKSYCAIEN
jgi:GNAT superfamily N-acetyltransferase